MCVCVRERERKKEKEGERALGRGKCERKSRQCVRECVPGCARVRERE